MFIGRRISRKLFPQTALVGRRLLSSTTNDEQIRETILRKALVYVHETGWRDECLVRAVKELDLPPLSHRIVSRGVSELVQFVLEEKLAFVNQKMGVDTTEFDTYNPDRLVSAINYHIDFILPYRAIWPEAIAVSLSPDEAPHTLQSALQLSDDLCHFCGIRSTRLDWYYERAHIAALYSGTELFLLTDSSDNAQDTRCCCLFILLSYLHLLNENMNVFYRDFAKRTVDQYTTMRKSPKSIFDMISRIGR